MAGILITGGAGFIGSHLVERFIETDENNIIVLDDLSAGSHNVNLLKSLQVKLIIGDIIDQESLATLPDGIETVFHLAAMNRAPRSIEDPERSNVVNITGTVNILEFARKNDCKLVFASSSSVFGHLSTVPRPEESYEFIPSHPYGLGKLASEHYCRLYNELYGLDTRIIRYFAVYGPRQSPKLTYSAVIPKFINAAINDQPVNIFGGDQSRNFTFVKDTVEATYILSKAKKVRKRLYQVGGREEITINELADIIEELSGRKLERQHLDYAKGDIFRSVPEMNNLKEEFDFTPRFTIREGLRETYQWFRTFRDYFG